MKTTILLIERDKDNIEGIKNFLGKEFYSIDPIRNWDDGLKKILANEYDIIILRKKLAGTKKDASWLLENLIKKRSDRLNSSFLISKGFSDNLESIKEILKGKKFSIINQDSKNYLYELEWSIINLVPQVFYHYRKKMEKSLDFYQKSQKIAENLENKIQNIDDLGDEQEKIKTNYVQWRNIAESLGTLVGAFSLVTGIIISLILLVSNQAMKLSEIKLSIVQIISIFFLISLIWGFILLLYFRLRSRKIIENKTEKIFEKKAKKIIERNMTEISEKFKKEK
jgi:response regulator RpfG family c-di-GMP phosphodiesterase